VQLPLRIPGLGPPTRGDWEKYNELKRDFDSNKGGIRRSWGESVGRKTGVGGKKSNWKGFLEITDGWKEIESEGKNQGELKR